MKQDARPIIASDRKENFCGNIDKFVASTAESMRDKEEKYALRIDVVHAKLLERSDSREETLRLGRSEWDMTRDNWKEALTKKASSTKQTTAVDGYIASVDRAVQARRSIVDGGLKDYHSAIDKTLKARQVAVKNALVALKADAAIAQKMAKADCALGVDPSSVRSAYIVRIKTAQEKLRTALEEVEITELALVPLVNSRKLAIEKANADFAQAIDAARARFMNDMEKE